MTITDENIMEFAEHVLLNYEWSPLTAIHRSNNSLYDSGSIQDIYEAWKCEYAMNSIKSYYDLNRWPSDIIIDPTTLDDPTKFYAYLRENIDNRLVVLSQNHIDDFPGVIDVNICRLIREGKITLHGNNDEYYCFMMIPCPYPSVSMPNSNTDIMDVSNDSEFMALVVDLAECLAMKYVSKPLDVAFMDKIVDNCVIVKYSIKPLKVDEFTRR